MTGFTTMFCPICEKNKEQSVDTCSKVKNIVTHRIYPPVKSNSFGGGPGTGKTITGVPIRAGPHAPGTNSIGILKVSHWTQQIALDKCVDIEYYLHRIGWHVGLTGGTLYKVGTRKDVDFIVYPHVINKMQQYSSVEINKIICIVAHLCGYEEADIQQSKHYRDGKLIFKIDADIDVFVFGV